MVTLHSGKQIIIDNKRIASKKKHVSHRKKAFKNTLTCQVLRKHNHSVIIWNIYRSSLTPWEYMIILM